MDLIDPNSIDAFVDEFLKTNRPLHILVNCARIMAKIRCNAMYEGMNLNLQQII